MTYFMKTWKMSRDSWFPRQWLVSDFGALVVVSVSVGVALSERLRLVPEESRSSFTVGGDMTPFAVAIALRVQR